VTLPVRPASLTALWKPLFTDETGLPLNSTKHVAISFRAVQRPMWTSSRGGIGAGVWRFLGGSLANRFPIENAALKIDVRSAGLGVR
jgi:hypothetical protein